MAIIKVAAPLAGIRGTVAGVTYSANASGPYAKIWATPANPRTAPQSIERSYLAQMPAAWNALSGAQQTAWDTFAALPAQARTNSLGETYYCSGFNWFTICNVRLLRLARAAITATPTQARPAAPSIDDFRVCQAGSESTLCSGGSVSTSSEDASYPATRAFDGTTSGNFIWRTATGVTAAWIQYTLPAAQTVKRLRYYGSDWDTSRLPRDFTFDVYTSGTWTPLLTVTDAPNSAASWFDFRFPNAYNETQYRMDITQSWGGSNYLTVAEIEMYSDTLGASCISYPQDEFSNSPNYDLVAHVSMGAGQGTQVKYPRYLQTFVTQTPDQWSELIQSEMQTVFGTIAQNRAWFLRLYRQTQEGIRSAAATFRTETEEA